MNSNKFLVVTVDSELLGIQYSNLINFKNLDIVGCANG